MRATAGINEPDLLFRNFVLDESIKVDNYEKLVCMRYWEEVYLEKEKYVKNLANWNIGKNDKSF
jgi:carbamoyl-phosphate synthase large subunit